MIGRERKRGGEREGWKIKKILIHIDNTIADVILCANNFSGVQMFVPFWRNIN